MWLVLVSLRYSCSDTHFKISPWSHLLCRLTIGLVHIFVMLKKTSDGHLSQKLVETKPKLKAHRSTEASRVDLI